MNKEQEANGGPTGTVQQSTNRLTTTGSTGGGQAHNILQPYIVTNYIIKAFQSAGTVATVIDNLNSTSTTDALSANQGKVIKELMQGTILYSDLTGATGNVTLLDSAENYDYIEIYYKFGQRSGSLKVKDFTNKKITLTILANSSATFVCIIKEITISGTTITKNAEYQFTHNAGSNPSYTETDGVAIYEVIGYKY